MRTLYTITLFLSSALLFLVQPMVAKMILPRLGGSPAVWTASMLFFQALLLAGYAYAHWSTRALGLRRQPKIHLLVLLGALAAIPLFLHTAHQLRTGEAAGLDSGNANPVFIALQVLAVLIGPLFFVVSAGAPLLQRWFSTTSDPHAKDPYFLYSASNVGSMLALLAYPFLLEPSFPLGTQALIWSVGYGLLVILMIACALVLPKAVTPRESQAELEQSEEAISKKSKLRWLILSAVPSSLLLGVTNYLTTNIAPMPLLWVVPLSLYLITFIVAFASKQYVKSGAWARVLPLIVTPLTLVMILEATDPIFILVAMHLAAFTVAALMCHTRLSETRPQASKLTEFYLWISLGGVLGGLFNALLAPIIFKTLAEYPVAILLACALRPAKAGIVQSLKKDVMVAASLAVALFGLVFMALQANMPPSPARTGLLIGLPAVICFLMVERPIRYALSLGSVFFVAAMTSVNSPGKILLTDRSFFGVHRVLERAHGRYHELVHGTTTHGIQDTLNPGEPLTYYVRQSPIGQVFDSYTGANRKENVALVGLGVGSCAAYGESGQHLTYFEIDPVVDQIAKDPQLFTYLRDCKAEVGVRLGDARLTLREEPNGKFGLIVLDAFSSDSIPIHLLTREAIQMYLTKLQPDGFLAFHISNRYLDLSPILAKIGESLGMTAYEDRFEPSQEELESGMRPSRWMVLARQREDIELLLAKHAWGQARSNPGTPLWTDDYSNILSAFNRDGG
ncbi:MAG: hypothetical protein BGO01_18525 [Armatimonadetes bacterium 55-13]|nr:fused MFS/spermidine synthase [Armatimonadota bacterium]OJU64127.1 MAG: hypothetical protein BGO01_18525 [Armatimonadetes bacterium 55-13]